MASVPSTFMKTEDFFTASSEWGILLEAPCGPGWDLTHRSAISFKSEKGGRQLWGFCSSKFFPLRSTFKFPSQVSWLSQFGLFSFLRKRDFPLSRNACCTCTLCMAMNTGDDSFLYEVWNYPHLVPFVTNSKPKVLSVILCANCSHLLWGPLV